MVQLAFVSACTATLAVIGYAIGMTIHQETLTALVPTFAGGAGGFGIGCAVLDVVSRLRSAKS